MRCLTKETRHLIMAVSNVKCLEKEQNTFHASMQNNTLVGDCMHAYTEK